jgi:FAD/FMN-containing dehydrogenase
MRRWERQSISLFENSRGATMRRVYKTKKELSGADSITSRLYSRMASIVGERYVAKDDYALYAVHADAGFEKGGIPEIIVRPQSTQQVAEIMKTANRHKIAVTVRGGASSAAGGATPVAPGGILMDLTDMNRILEINLNTSTITAEAGITFGEIAAKLHPMNFTFCLGGHALYSATLGGCIANTSVSIGSGFYGLFGEQVVNLKVVTPTGQIICTGSDAMKAGGRFQRYCNGPDLTGLFIGDSGILGVKTEASLRIYPMPEARRFEVYCYDSLERGTMAAIRQEQVGLFDGIINFGTHTINVVKAPGGAAAKIPEGTQLILRLSLAGDEPQVDYKLKKLDRIARDYGGVKIGPELAKAVTYDIMGIEFSKLRVYGVIAPIACLVPMIKIPEITKVVEEYLKQYEDVILDIKGTDLKSWTNTGVLTKGASISYAGRISFTEDPELREKAYQVWHNLLEKMIELGGCPYWTGKTWTPHMVRGYRPEYLQFLRSLKRWLDPNNILNRGLLLEELDKKEM